MLSAARCRRGSCTCSRGKRHAHRLPESRDRRAAAAERHHVGRDTGDNRRARSRRAAACARVRDQARRVESRSPNLRWRRSPHGGCARQTRGIPLLFAPRGWRDERHVLAARGARRADRDRFPRGGHGRACCAIRMRAASCCRPRAGRRQRDARSRQHANGRASGRRCRPMRPRTAPRTSADPARARRAANRSAPYSTDGDSISRRIRVSYGECMTSTIRTSEAAGCSGFSRKLCACGTTTLGTQRARLRVQPLGAGAAGPVDVGSPVLRRVALRISAISIDRPPRCEATGIRSAIARPWRFRNERASRAVRRRMLGEIRRAARQNASARRRNPPIPFRSAKLPSACRQAKYPSSICVRASSTSRAPCSVLAMSSDVRPPSAEARCAAMPSPSPGRRTWLSPVRPRETDRLVGFLLRQAFVRLATTQRATRNDEGQLVGFQPALGQTVDHRDVDAGARQLGRSAPIGHGSPAAVRES